MKKFIRAERFEQEQEPTTDFFSKAHLIVSDFPPNNGTQNTISPFEQPHSVRLYALGRKVGLYTKEVSISGFIELNDASSLNYPRTRCDSFAIRTALEE